jgi:eukaryotic-like serine/threonine-protein kinase
LSKETPDLVEAGTVLAGRYRVVRQLGKGGMGSVYLVQHLHTDQQLALKVLHATVVTDELALTRFRREARAPARVGSDHVVQVTDADVAPELGGVPFLVMEWLRGQDLEELTSGGRALPPEDVVRYLRQAARALDKAHGLGIVHRDLKPENLFLTKREDGTPCVKILDFGIAKLNESTEEAGRFKSTGTGQIFGTPLYMSPEQTKAETDKVGPGSDIWALGIMAHRLLIGTEPWTATTLTALISQVAFEPLPVPSQRGNDRGPGFDAWFARCCAREPADRFPTAGEAIAALGRALQVASEETLLPTPRSSSPSAVVRPPREEIDRTAFSATAPAPLSASAPTKQSAELPRPRRSYAPAVAAAATAFGVALGAIFYLSGRSTPAPVAVAPPESTTHAAAGAGTTPAAIVTPSSAALPDPTPPATAATTTAAATSDPKKPPRPTDKPPVARPPPTATAVAPPPTATAVAPPPPTTPTPPPTADNPLGTRH